MSERGTRGVHSLISMSLYSIVPTLIELTLVLTVLGVKFDAVFVWITLAALVLYITFTVTVTPPMRTTSWLQSKW